MPINFTKHAHRQRDLNKEISDLVKSLKREKKKRFGFWEKAVGEKISEIAVPYRLKNDILLIKVTDSVWRFELTKRKEELLQSVNNYTENKIKDIIFK
jgi:predicted nucleic acid-binding Zn ribbon protein